MVLACHMVFSVSEGPSAAKPRRSSPLGAPRPAGAWPAIRVCGWVLAWLGLQLLVGPLTVAPEIVPWVGATIGDLVGATLCYVTFAVATSTTLTVAALVHTFLD